MDDYPYPITAEGDWRPEHAKSVKNKLQIYFQSKKKSQGGDCIMQYDDKCNFATILFKSSDSRDGVLSKAKHIITIDNQQIELKVYKHIIGQKVNIIRLVAKYGCHFSI
uniref:PAR14-like first RRM domain-containing protein n=1 Tax=Sinocyclocheilus grahami TaxID=75366 RepID=A0A672S1M7_SINGR